MTVNKVLATPFTQINIGKRIAATSALFKELKSNDICVIQEPLVNKFNRMSSVPKSHQPILPYSKERCRVACVIPKDLYKKTMALGAFASKDSLVLRMRFSPSITLLVASVYMEDKKPIPSNLISRI